MATLHATYSFGSTKNANESLNDSIDDSHTSLGSSKPSVDVTVDIVLDALNTIAKIPVIIFPSDLPANDDEKGLKAFPDAATAFIVLSSQAARFATLDSSPHSP